MTTTGIDNYDWLQAVDDHPKTTNAHVAAAYALLSIKTTLGEQDATLLLVELTALRLLEVVGISDDDRTYTYALRIPNAVAA
jgi:hypothetical protein